MVRAQSTSALRGHEGQPVVVEVDGKPMMDLVSASPNIVQALDLSDPDNPVQIWNYGKKTDRRDGTLLRAHKFVRVNWAEMVDLETGRPVKVKEHSPFAVGQNAQACRSAMGGSLVFNGSLGGDFRLVNRETGEVEWERKLGCGIIGNPITYKTDGWIGLPITVGLDLSGKYGAIGATAMAKATGLDKIPQGGTLYTFHMYD